VRPLWRDDHGYEDANDGGWQADLYTLCGKMLDNIQDNFHRYLLFAASLTPRFTEVPTRNKNLKYVIINPY
jgi:hypothetical protein